MPKKTKLLQSGAVNLLLVMFMVVVATIIIATIQSRLLLSIFRSRSQSDVLIASYDAESAVNDVLARVLGNYPGVLPINIPYNPPLQSGLTLGDGTIVSMTATQSGTTQTIDVTARRPYGVSQIQGVRTLSAAGSSGKADIILMLDCSGSMGTDAIYGDSSSGTRFEAERRAALEVVDSLNKPENVGNVRIGVIYFGGYSAWLTDASGDLTPTDDYNRLHAAIESGLSGRGPGVSPLCGPLLALHAAFASGTDLGAPLVMAYQYMTTVADSTIHKIGILITDGAPNARIVYPQCPVSVDCRYLSNAATCVPKAIDFLRCTLADTRTPFSGLGVPGNGVRDPSVDLYAAMTIQTPDAQCTDFTQYNSRGALCGETTWQVQQTFDAFNQFLTHTPEHFYNNSNANLIASNLQIILQQISTTVGSITIRRIVP